MIISTWPSSRFIPPRAKRHQNGFTMVELLVAASLSLILVLVVMEMLIGTQALAETMVNRVRFNAEARLMFDLLANGGFADLDANGVPEPSLPADRITGFRGGRGWDPALGIRSFDNHPNNNDYNELKYIDLGPFNNVLNGTQKSFNTLQSVYFRSTTDQPKTVSSQSPTRITCTTAGVPHPDCIATESPFIGYLFNRRPTETNRLVDTDRAIFGKSVDIKLELVDPEIIKTNHYSSNPPVDETEAGFRSISPDARESYRFSFMMLVDY